MSNLAETAFKLRSPNFRSVQVTAPSGGYTAGQLVQLNSGVIGIVVETATVGEEVAVVTWAEKAVVPSVAVATGAFLVGAPVYYDVADDEINESSSGNHMCGFVTEPGVTGAETVEIEFNGALALVD